MNNEQLRVKNYYNRHCFCNLCNLYAKNYKHSKIRGLLS